MVKTRKMKMRKRGGDPPSSSSNSARKLKSAIKPKKSSKHSIAKKTKTKTPEDDTRRRSGRISDNPLVYYERFKTRQIENPKFEKVQDSDSEITKIIGELLNFFDFYNSANVAKKRYIVAIISIVWPDDNYGPGKHQGHTLFIYTDMENLGTLFVGDVGKDGDKYYNTDINESGKRVNHNYNLVIDNVASALGGLTIKFVFDHFRYLLTPPKNFCEGPLVVTLIIPPVASPY